MPQKSIGFDVEIKRNPNLGSSPPSFGSSTACPIRHPVNNALAPGKAPEGIEAGAVESGEEARGPDPSLKLSTLTLPAFAREPAV